MTQLFDVEAEEAFLGACLTSQKFVDVGIDRGLAPAHFFVLAHAEVWQAMLRRADTGAPVDAHLVQADLASRPDIRADLCDYLTGSGYLSPAAATAYANRVVELALWRHRQHQAVAIQVATEAMDEDAFARAESSLGTTHRPDETTYSPAQLAEQVFAMLEEGEQCFSWPFPRWNTLTSGGMRRGEVTLLGGWTSHGKSVVLDQVLDRAVADGHKVHLFINEMTPRQRAARTVARRTGILLSSLLQNELTVKQRASVVSVLNDLPYAITDAAGWNATQIARAIRRMRPDVVGVDILHLIEHRDERDVAQISAELNRAAKQAECHIIATVHLNENRVMGQTRPMPTIGDIRGSGMLKNDADNVLFVFREQDADTGYPQHEATGYFAKVRSGEPGGLALTFNGARMEFTDRSWRNAA